MPLEKIPEAVAALENIAALLGDIGVPGMVLLMLSGPAAIILAILIIELLRSKQARTAFELYRKDVEAQRAETMLLVEQHRADTHSILRDLGAKHAEVSQFYKDNVELVKLTQRMATDMRDIIVNNTRAVEHVASLAQANFFCPIAREAATGKK